MAAQVDHLIMRRSHDHNTYVGTRKINLLIKLPTFSTGVTSLNTSINYNLYIFIVLCFHLFWGEDDGKE